MCDGVMEKTIEHKGMMRERERDKQVRVLYRGKRPCSHHADDLEALKGITAVCVCVCVLQEMKNYLHPCTAKSRAQNQERKSEREHNR